MLKKIAKAISIIILVIIQILLTIIMIISLWQGKYLGILILMGVHVLVGTLVKRLIDDYYIPDVN